MSRDATEPLGFEKIELASLTDVGIRRTHNQDAYGVLLAPSLDTWRERGHIFIVADGMGAHAVGELASSIAAELIPHTYQKHAASGAEAALRRAFDEANVNIHQRGLQNREFQGMGTTSTAVLLRPEGVWVAHVGDSRAYRIRGQFVEQLSFDHSLQWELARRQQVSPESIAGIPSNVIVRSLGPEASVQVDIEGPHPLQPGDTFVLCSDGLSNQLSDQEMGAVFNLLPMQEACQFLVDLANLRGGPDKITVVGIRVPGTPVETGVFQIEPPGDSWLRRLPWPVMSVFLGVGLAIATLFMSLEAKQAYHSTGLLLFAVSVVLVLVGLVGVLLRRRAELAEQARFSDEDALQIYRRVTAQVETALVQKLMQTEANLLELIKEKGWPVDDANLQAHKKQVAKALKEGDVTAAFQKQCRSLGLLTAVLRQHRNKDEQFKPNW
jgi:PPM family protein phosphatase